MFLIDNECSLCGEQYNYSYLYRCRRCRRLYCRNCFLFDKDGQVICLRCARETVSPQGQRGKYANLSVYLAKKAKYTDHVTLSFIEIEELIGDKLPFSAHNYTHWWSNIRNRSPSEAWMTVGWRIQNVDLEEREVTFKREETEPVKSPQGKRRLKRKPVSASFKALARKTKPKKPKEPSKTKIAMVQARLRNIEQRRTVKEYRGKLKSKTAYEKRLYKPEERPDEA